MDQPDKNAKKQRLICLCNAISQATIEQAIVSGSDTLGKIFDSTTAGVGPCGGSCQPTLKKILTSYQKTGRFLENPMPPPRRRRTRR